MNINRIKKNIKKVEEIVENIDVQDVINRMETDKENSIKNERSSIEEDIARIARLITTKFNNDYSIDNKDKEAIEHILSDYKRVLKENEELRENYRCAQACANMVFDKIIPVQKVKDKIEELKQEIENLPAEAYPIIEDDLQIKIEALEELLNKEK